MSSFRARRQRLLAQAIESLESRTLFAGLPAHTVLAQRSVAETLPENNVYSNATPVVTWAGINGATLTTNSSDCTTYITTVLKQAYGFTNTQFTTWTGSTSPSLPRYWDAINANTGFEGFKDITRVRVGDMFICRYPSDVSPYGHMVEVDALPTLLTSSATQRTYSLTIIDSTSSPHSNDTRNNAEANGDDDTGIGRGNIKIYTDGNGVLDSWSWGTSASSTHYDPSDHPVMFAKMPTTVADANFAPTTAGNVQFTFNTAMLSSSITASDLSISNLTTGQTFSASAVLVNNGNTTATFALPMTSLTNGNYRFRITSGAATSAVNNALAATYTLQDGDVFVLNGDVNHDRHVDAQDQAILTANFGQTGRTYGHGDLNYDGTVNAADQAILDANWHDWLPANGAASINGTAGNDNYRLKRGTSTLLDLYVNGDTSPTMRIIKAPLTALDIALSDGVDNLRLDYSNGDLLASGLTYNGGAGVDTLTIIGTTGPDSTTFSSSQTSTVTFNGVAVGAKNMGTIIFDGQSGLDTVSITGGMLVQLPGTQRLQSLTMTGTSKAELPTNTNALLITRTLSIGASASLDLNDNDLLAANTSKSTIEGYVRTAYNFGDWQGAGGIFSSAAELNPNGNTTLGVMSGQEFNDNNGGAFDGQSINATDVLVKYTYFGDVDFNGQVDVSDYNLIDFGFTNHLTGWANGDADYSSDVDASDYNVIDFAFATQGGVL